MVMVFPDTLADARNAPRDIKGSVAYTNSEGNMLRRPLFSVQEFEELGYRLSTYPTRCYVP